MNTSAVEKIANAVLYEGYLLYPYRASAVKNQQRFNFGVLYPRRYAEMQTGGSDLWEMRTECLVQGDKMCCVEAKLRFLQLQTRGERQEGQEREVYTPIRSLGAIADETYRQQMAFEGSEALAGELDLAAVELADALFRVTLRVRNCAELEDTSSLDRDGVLRQSFVSLHAILHAARGEFISSIDPPEEFKTAAAACENAGLWPVLAGDEGQRDLILSAPIILYDYPRIAPESPGDLFDGTEIDEILALRILTMTDSEKLEVRQGDDRARKILERTEMLPAEHFEKLHGALRGLHPLPEGPSR